MSNIILHNHLGRNFDDVMMTYAMLYNYKCFKALNATRHGVVPSRRLVQHLLKRLALHCNHMRQCIGSFKTHKLNSREFIVLHLCVLYLL